MKPPAQSSSCLHCRSAGSAHSAGSAVPLRLHAVSACASTQPLSSERGSAAATVTRLSCRAPSAVPLCPAQPTPPLDRSCVGSTPATIYPRARAQLFSCPWRCERARRCNRFARGARRCNRYARGAWRREGRGPALRGRHEGRGPALELGRGGRRAAWQGQGGYGERSFQSKAGELCTVANIVHIDCHRPVEETMYTMIHALPTGCCRDDAAPSGY